MKTSAIVLSGLMFLTTLCAAATPPAGVPIAGAVNHGLRSGSPPFGTAPNTAYEQALTAYMNNVLLMAQKHRAPTGPVSRERNADARSEAPASGAAHLPSVVDVADLPQVEAIMIGRRAKARLMTASGGLLVVGVHDVTRYGTVTRIDSTGVWLTPEGFARPILLEDLTPNEMAAESGSGGARAVGPYGGGESIATPPIPISPSRSRLPSGVSRN
jgi:hypothetical protein